MAHDWQTLNHFADIGTAQRGVTLSNLGAGFMKRGGSTLDFLDEQSSQINVLIGGRMRGRGLQPGPEVVGMLAERVEGNLLAAAQEIDKLLLLHGPGPLDAEQLLAAVADSARFDVFGLIDSALQGQAGRCLRMLDGLHAEDVPAPVVLWALAREVRSLASMACMRSAERLKPMARRSSSASPPLKPATAMAMRRSCSWKRGTPRVRFRIGSSSGWA